MESMEVPEGLADPQSVLDWLAAQGSMQPQTSITESLWERVTERYGAQAHETYGPIDRDRPPAGVKDWNQALQQVRTQITDADLPPHGPQRAGEREREDLADRRPS